MERPQSFDAIKILLAELDAGHIHREEDIPLNAANNINYDTVYNERLKKLFAGYNDLYRAAQNRDRDAIRAALLRVKIHLLSLTSFFIALEDDCICLLSRSVEGCPAPDTAQQTPGGRGGARV